MLDRRDFLRYSLAFAGQSAVAHLALADETTPIWEGIYTNRFTYRRGIDPIQVHASLLDVTAVDVTLKHVDGPTLDAVVGVYPIVVDSTQTSSYSGEPTGGAGVHGPMFPARISLDTTGMEPGLYEISIDPNAIRPENRENYSGSGWASHNHLSRFVITAEIPGSHSNILWVHDSTTATAYGAFGGESIYPGATAAGVDTVSFLRPGLDRGTHRNKWALRKLKADGHLFEYMDVVEFSLQPASITQNFDLIVLCGQFEYLSHQFFANLKSHIDEGRNLLICSNEFGTFRTRLGPAAENMTTFRFDAPSDPIQTGQDRASVGMLIDETIWETEFGGCTVWSAHNLGAAPAQDMPLTNLDDTAWLIEGTGFQDLLPGFLAYFNAGNRGSMQSGARFRLLDTIDTRAPSATVVWAALPSPDARSWWMAAPGQDVSTWPIDPDGHALCTWRETTNGARIICLPSQGTLQNKHAAPGYARLFENIFAYLLQPTPIPAVRSLGLGVLAAATVATGSRLLARRRDDD